MMRTNTTTAQVPDEAQGDGGYTYLNPRWADLIAPDWSTPPVPEVTVTPNGNILSSPLPPIGAEPQPQEFIRDRYFVDGPHSGFCPPRTHYHIEQEIDSLYVYRDIVSIENGIDIPGLFSVFIDAQALCISDTRVDPSNCLNVHILWDDGIIFSSDELSLGVQSWYLALPVDWFHDDGSGDIDVPSRISLDPDPTPIKNTSPFETARDLYKKGALKDMSVPEFIQFVEDLGK